MKVGNKAEILHRKIIRSYLEYMQIMKELKGWVKANNEAMIKATTTDMQAKKSETKRLIQDLASIYNLTVNYDKTMPAPFKTLLRFITNNEGYQVTLRPLYNCLK